MRNSFFPLFLHSNHSLLQEEFKRLRKVCVIFFLFVLQDQDVCV